ncbi:MAG: sigma-70 family RNA polymerase sigma factor [Nocardioides sp.]
MSTDASLALSRPPPAVEVSRSERRHLTEDLFAHLGPLGTPAREEALQRIVVLHVPTARSLARGFRGRGVELDDLEQTACIALLRAVRAFDPALGHGFLAYAVPTIRGALRRHFRDFGWMVRPPRTLQELQRKVGAYAFERDPDSGRPLSPEQVAARLHTSCAAVREASGLAGCFQPSSLDAPSDPAGVGTLMDRLPGRGDPGFEAAELRAALAPVFAALTTRDRRLLHMRFVEERTQQEIADELGLTQSQVSRKLVQLLAQLRGLLAVGADLVSAGS